jgi:hypothetical protein
MAEPDIEQTHQAEPAQQPDAFAALAGMFGQGDQQMAEPWDVISVQELWARVARDFPLQAEIVRLRVAVERQARHIEQLESMNQSLAAQRVTGSGDSDQAS